jgi:hypothetical protein
MGVNKIMNFKKFINIIESKKEDLLNTILDKINKGIELSKSDELFLKNYDKEIPNDMKYLDKELVYVKIKDIIDSGVKILCNLTDRNGRIGIFIKEIDGEFGQDFSILTLTNGDRIKIKDNFFYNIIWNQDKGFWILEEGDEFFEKIPVD